MAESAKEIAAYFRRVAAALPREMLKAEKENAKDALATAVRWTSGPLSSAQLAAAGHPYRPEASHPASFPEVNRQSGGVVGSWRMDGPRLIGGAYVTVIDDTDPVAKWLEDGTPRMVARDLVTAILAEVTPRAEMRRQAAIDRAFGA